MLAGNPLADESSPAMSTLADSRSAMAIEQPVKAFFTISCSPGLTRFTTTGQNLHNRYS